MAAEGVWDIPEVVYDTAQERIMMCIPILH